MINFLNLSELKKTYSSIDDNLIDDLIVPVLSRSVKYDRAVGFFSSSWLKEVAKGLAIFARFGGKARIVTSVKLSDQDWKAIQDGQNPEMHIQTVIDKQVFNTIQELTEAIEIETLATLSWMIAQNILEFRFAMPIGKLQGGIFHTKLFLFYDQDNNGIAVFGSQNDSHQSTINEESLSVYTSWNFGKDYFEEYKNDFEKKWQGNSNTLKTYTISEAAKNKIIYAGKNYTCPYLRKEGIQAEILTEQPSEDMHPSKSLRPYQNKAIENWESNNYNGLFEMATGSGKTFTSISAANKLYERNGTLCLVVLAPYKHLVTQWAKELESFGFDPILCFEDSKKWQDEAYPELQKYKAGITKKVCFVATHATSAMKPFQEFIQSINHDWLIIADEVHGLGSEKQSISLFPDAKYRIGLSATPRRWYDEAGSERLMNYFKKIVVEYDLKNAIEDKALTKYEYNPVLTELTDIELFNFEILTRKIGLIVVKKKKTKEDKEYLEKLCRERAKIIGKAENKLSILIGLVQQHRNDILEKGEKYIHNLFYCAPGEHKQILEALSAIGLKVHEFVADVKQSDRTKILKAFEEGSIEGLVAIKCLDEGVDIPATKRAYILASSTNPREFIQRRGRVLRKSDETGKTKAYIYDFMIGPWTPDLYDYNTGQCLLKRELPRFSEFNNLNDLKYETQEKIKYACEHFDTMNEIDMKPWEVYAKIIAENLYDIA